MKKSIDAVLFSVIGYGMISIMALICAIPFLMVLAGSFTEESMILQYGYSLWPREISFAAYGIVFQNPSSILNAYKVTILVTVVGTLISLFITSMTGYVLQKKELRTRNYFSLLFYFTTLFNGGLVSWYILITKYLHIKNTYLALILPPMLSVFYIIVMRSFISSIPDSLTESAKIDGAGEFTIYLQIILPLSRAALATIGIFTALGYWNDWFHSMLFINNNNMFSLQYFLYKLLNSLEFANKAASMGSNIIIEHMPAESFKLAMTIVATGPIVILYPSLQRFFVKGLTIGAVKG